MDEIEVNTARGHSVRLSYRSGTSDLSTIGSTYRLWGKFEDEYQLASLTVNGVFVDVGAHIGSVVLAVLADNPKATAIAVEPLSENCDVMRASAIASGLMDRLTILQAAVAPGGSVEIAYDFQGDDYLRNHRYIGGMMLGQTTATRSVSVPTVSIRSLVKMAGGSVAAMKLDCEGCEWDALRSKYVKDIVVIFGEWHGHAIDQRAGLPDLEALIGATHDVSVIADHGGTGIFKAVRR